jgi:hypothetical protein
MKTGQKTITYIKCWIIYQYTPNKNGLKIADLWSRGGAVPQVLQE